MDLLPHRATYELRLERSSQGSGIENAHGLLVVEVADACDTWDLRQAIVLTLVREESQISTSSEFDSREAKDGSWYRFDERTRVEPGGTDLFRGQAEAHPDVIGRIAIERPLPDEAALPAGTLFPTAHLVSILRNAMAGRHLMTDIMFDGTEGTRVYDVTSVVGTMETDPETGLRVWPLRLGYFYHDSLNELPELELSARLREDGVSMGLSYDYGSFVLRAVLQSLEPLPEPEC